MSHLAVVPNEGELAALRMIQGEMGNGGANSWHLILFENDITPDDETIISALTEPSDANYTPPEVTPSFAASGGDGKAAMVFSTGVFYADGPDGTHDIYGWALRLTSSSPSGQWLMACARFSDAPRSIEDASDAISITLRYTLKREIHVEA
jgi:hypothetical protein